MDNPSQPHLEGVQRANDRRPKWLKWCSELRSNSKKIITMLTKQEKNSIIHFVCLGDGYLRKLENGKNYQLAISHDIKQIKFLKWKRDLLEECLGKNIKIRISKRLNHDKTKIREICTITVSDAKFNKVYNRLYKDRRKIITQKFLNRINSVGLAIWFGDDGSAYYRKDRKKGFFVDICVCEFNEQEIEKIINILKEKFNIDCLKYTSGKNNWGNKQYFRIRIHKHNSIKRFMELVSPCLKGKLDYKLCNL